MSAVDTAQRVINWAVADGENDAPPKGEMLSIVSLLKPTSAMIEGITDLFRLTNTKLRFADPPLGSNEKISPDVIILAAAIGASEQPAAACELLKAVPNSRVPVDWVARHGLIGKATKFLPGKLVDYYLAKSPLTGVFYRPAKSREAESLNIIMQLIKYPAERLSLILHFAELSNDVDVMRWRKSVLDRMCRGIGLNKNFVLDVYEAMMMYFEDEVIKRVKQANSVFHTRNDCDNEALDMVFAFAEFWEPLYLLDRGNKDELESREYLGYSYRECIDLFKLYLRMKGVCVN